MWITKGDCPQVIMKRKTSISNRTRIVTLALCAAGCAAFAQGPGDQGGPGGPAQGNGPGGQGGQRPPPPLPPILQALDTNHDGILEADEINNAAQSLRTLEKSGSDQLTIPELLGPPHHHRGPQGQGQGGGPANPGAQTSGSNEQGQGNPPPPPPDGPGGQDGPPPGPPPDGGPGGPGGGPGRHHPPSPLAAALDTNHDGILDANEIANAAQSLKALENADGQIVLKDLRPPPPPMQSGTNGQGNPPPPPPPE